MPTRLRFEPGLSAGQRRPPGGRGLVRLAELVQLAAVHPLQVGQQEGLVGPVHQPAGRDPGVQDHVDQVHRGEVLHVLDALFGEPRLVPQVEPVELVERVFRGDRRDEPAQGPGRHPLQGLQADEREEADDEGDGELGRAR